MLVKFVKEDRKPVDAPMVVVLNKELVPDLYLLQPPSARGGFHNFELIGEQARALLDAGDLKDGSSVDISILENKKLMQVTFIMVPMKPTKKDLATRSKTVGQAVKRYLGTYNEVQVFDAIASVNPDTGIPETTIIRGISNELYDYKDSLKNPDVKTVHLLHPLHFADTQDINIHDSMKFVRDLVTSPPNTVVPQTLVEEAKKLVGKKIKMVNHDPAKENMAGLLAVGRGSSLDPEFIELQYKGNKTSQIDYVLIGKGITFDSGGYSLKPAKSMETMKGDMAGAATVLGVFKHLKEHGSDLNIVGLIPTCENMIGRDAIAPGEVINYSNGKSVEVLNTDAEGRLILADALIYSQKFNAKVIDIATLTGGIVAALGSHRSGLFGNDQALIEEIKECAEETQDLVWEMPMDEEVYSPKSEVADMKNISSGPSAITAALFLREFAPERWAHLDIAGTSGESVGTGRPLPLLAKLVGYQITLEDY